MYRLVKDEGLTAPIWIVNGQTEARANLGVMNTKLISILLSKEDLLTPLEEGQTYTSYIVNNPQLKISWNTIIGEDTAQEIIDTCLAIHKTHNKQKPKQKKPVDALDIIYNLNKKGDK